MAQVIQMRRGLASEWTAANPLLAEGEQGVELDTHKWKVGDGVLRWSALPYVTGGPGPPGADSTVPGPQGPQGATGPTGPTGPKGDIGPRVRKVTPALPRRYPARAGHKGPGHRARKVTPGHRVRSGAGARQW